MNDLSSKIFKFFLLPKIVFLLCTSCAKQCSPENGNHFRESVRERYFAKTVYFTINSLQITDSQTTHFYKTITEQGITQMTFYANWFHFKNFMEHHVMSLICSARILYGKTTLSYILGLIA